MHSLSPSMLTGFLLVVAAATGCTDGGARSFRNDDADLFSTMNADSEMLSGIESEEMNSPDSDQTLVATVSAEQPPQPSLMTLGAGDDLRRVVKAAQGPVLLDFYADWCGPCRIQGKILHELERDAAQHGMLMVKINIDEHPEIARELQVEGIPTLIMVKEGRVVQRQSGVAERDRLLAWMQ